MQVVQYDSTYRQRWDDFNRAAKNGHFLFFRDYMEYHADRFRDGSLLFFEADKLVALLPGTIAGEQYVSHGGLTFGGFIIDRRMTAPRMLRLFDALVPALVERGLSTLVYKAIPHIYHQVPAEEDLYALFRHGATLIRRDISSTLALRARLPYTKGRKWSVNQGKKRGIVVAQSEDFARFMAIEEYVLGTRYGLKPVHSAEEIAMLAGKFPANIKLFAASLDEEMHAGVIVYENAQVAHAQYISSTDEGKGMGAADRIIDYLINEYYADKEYFDFGISTEQAGRYLNEGLIENKESFGARSVVYDFYELALS